MPPPYLNLMRVVSEFNVGSEIQANVMHVRSLAAYDFNAHADSIIDAFEVMFTALTSAAAPNRGIGNIRSADHVLSRIVATDLSVASGDTIEQTMSVAGTGAGDILPLQTAMLVSLKTALASRRGRGRIYLGGFTESGVADAGTDSRWVTTWITDTLDALEDLNDRLGAIGAGYALAVLSEADGLSRLVTQFRLDAVPRSQRRRANKLRGSYTNRTA